MKRILAFLAFGLSLSSFASQSQPTLPAELKMEKPRKVRFPFYYFERAVNGNLIGRGSDQALFCIYTSHTRGYQLDALTIDLTGTTDLRDVTVLKLYRTKNNDRFDPRDPGELLATAKVGKKGLIPFSINKQLKEEDALWVVADIAPKAQEGHQVSAEVSTIIADNLELEGLTTERHTQEIVLQRTLLWAPGEAGSKHYRIPGIVRLSDGTLVASIDRRKEKDGDLPADIDVEVKRSTDDGRTWSAPITVATGTKEHGYGDAAMATDGKTIYMVMVGGAGLWTYPSISKEHSQMYFTKSSDGGKTWEPLTNITKQVYLGPYAWGASSPRVMGSSPLRGVSSSSPLSAQTRAGVGRWTTSSSIRMTRGRAGRSLRPPVMMATNRRSSSSLMVRSSSPVAIVPLALMPAPTS